MEQVIGDPATQLFDVLHVGAGVYVLPEHEPVLPQSELALHWTQPLAALQRGVGALHVVDPATQVLVVVLHVAPVYVLPLHEPVPQSLFVLHWTQPLAALQTSGGDAAPQLIIE
jgi:hypothetical protein